MSEPYLGLLIGSAPDLPPLFESQSDDIEWLVEQTARFQRGLSLLRRRRFDLVLVEDARPTAGGGDLVAQLHAIQPGVPVILIDAVPSPADVIDAMQQQA